MVVGESRCECVLSSRSWSFLLLSFPDFKQWLVGCLISPPNHMTARPALSVLFYIPQTRRCSAPLDGRTSKSRYCSVDAPSRCAYADLMKDPVVNQNKQRRLPDATVLVAATTAHNPMARLQSQSGQFSWQLESAARSGSKRNSSTDDHNRPEAIANRCGRGARSNAGLGRRELPTADPSS